MKAILFCISKNVLFKLFSFSFWFQKNPFAGVVLCGALLGELYL